MREHSVHERDRHTVAGGPEEEMAEAVVNGLAGQRWDVECPCGRNADIPPNFRHSNYACHCGRHYIAGFIVGRPRVWLLFREGLWR